MGYSNYIKRNEKFNYKEMQIEINIGNNLLEALKLLSPDEIRVVLMSMLKKIEILADRETDKEKEDDND